MKKIYSKAGDQGYTTSADGQLVAKSSELIELYGCLDELNVFLGYAAEGLAAHEEWEAVTQQLRLLQQELLALDLVQVERGELVVAPAQFQRLEQASDHMASQLSSLNGFAIPGGGEAGLRLHLARTACRRAERAFFRTVPTPQTEAGFGAYLNRLSDWLYLLALTIAQQRPIARA